MSWFISMTTVISVLVIGTANLACQSGPGCFHTGPWFLDRFLKLDATQHRSFNSKPELHLPWNVGFCRFDLGVICTLSGSKFGLLSIVSICLNFWKLEGMKLLLKFSTSHFNIAMHTIKLQNLNLFIKYCESKSIQTKTSEFQANVAECTREKYLEERNESFEPMWQNKWRDKYRREKFQN